MNRFALAASSALLLLAGLAHADQTSLGKFTLAPGEKKAVTLDAKGETKVGFTNQGSIDDAKRCLKMCIHMTVPGNIFLDATASVGTSMKIAPKDGKIQVQFENLEAFPVSIDVYRE